MLNYNHWDNVVGEIVCAFDSKPELVGNLNVPCFNIKDLDKKMPKGIRIAILTITDNVQETVDQLVKCGIKAFVDFTNEHFILPKGTMVRNIDVVSTIQELVFETNKIEEEK